MKVAIPFLLAMIIAGCSQDADTKGVVYTGNADLKTQLRQFTATHADNEKDIILNMTGPRELTFHYNDKISYIDYEEDVIIFKSETNQSEWTAKKVKGGFELEDGTILQYGNCKGWAICLLDGNTQLPILKGDYLLKGSSAKITLWISESEKHVELLGLMANGLFNRSKNEKDSIDSSLETVSPQVWTY